MTTERSTVFLMANLGSEIERLYMAHDSGDRGKITGSYERAVAIITELENRDDIGNGKGEVELVKGVVDDIASANPQLSVRAEDMRSYFLPFAMRALSGR